MISVNDRQLHIDEIEWFEVKDYDLILSDYRLEMNVSGTIKLTFDTQLYELSI